MVGVNCSERDWFPIEKFFSVKEYVMVVVLDKTGTLKTSSQSVVDPAEVALISRMQNGRFMTSELGGSS